MSLRSILVLLTAPEGAEATLAVAADATRALTQPPETPSIEVLHVRLDPLQTIMPTEEVLTPERIAELDAESVVEGAATFAAFNAWKQAGHQGTWTEVVGDPAEVVVTRAKDATLVALPLPAKHAPLTDRAALEAAVFKSGRPTLVVPAAWRGGFGRHLAVGWKDSDATRNALEAMRPWLAAADRVTVLTVGQDSPPLDGPLAGLQGRVEQKVIAPAHHGDGAALLEAALACGADALAMGAYRRGRLLEWALGGVTEHALHHATLPLLLTH